MTGVTVNVICEAVEVILSAVRPRDLFMGLRG